MKKSALILKSGMLLVVLLCIFSISRGQNTKVAPVESTSSGDSTKEQTPSLSSDSSKTSVSITGTRVQNTQGRNCDPISSREPYSISRKDFENLPEDRKQFVLDNLNKYTIVE